ncbi:MAG: hypothetical protein Q8N55_00715 [bacterium]|nr:hypothetical protein [bacterium]
MAQDVKEIKNKIISIIRLRGPSLPVHITHQTGINSIFAGALLSELFAEKLIKISNMKVGGSPLYFLQGQEHLLENFHQYLPGKEKEAFLTLKENKILQDKEQLPAIRVALRSLHDFAKSFSKDNEIFWRFHSTTETQVREMLEPKPEAKIEKPVEKPKMPAEVLKKLVLEPKSKLETKEEEIKVKIKNPRKTQKQELSKQENLDIGLKKEKQPKIKEAKPAKIKEKSDFVLKIISFLQAQNIELLEERGLKKKEFSGVIRIDSPLGKIKLLCIAKDKKSITETDLRLALQKSQAIKMPALILYPQEPSQRTLDYAEKWSSLLKLKKIE